MPSDAAGLRLGGGGLARARRADAAHRRHLARYGQDAARLGQAFSPERPGQAERTRDQAAPEDTEPRR